MAYLTVKGHIQDVEVCLSRALDFQAYPVQKLPDTLSPYTFEFYKAALFARTMKDLRKTKLFFPYPSVPKQYLESIPRTITYKAKNND